MTLCFIGVISCRDSYGDMEARSAYLDNRSTLKSDPILIIGLSLGLGLSDVRSGQPSPVG